MPREPTFGRDAIEEQFEELAASLDRATTVYLIGGGAMTLTDQKDATKDIDLVVDSARAFDDIVDALKNAGYSSEDEPEPEYDALGTAVILERGDRRFDIFDRQVTHELVLTDTIEERSELIMEKPPLTVRRFADEDIFLFKAVANRPDDLDDMATLLGPGLDFDVVLDELDGQIAALDDDAYVTSIHKKLERLEEHTGIRPDFADEIAEMHEVSSRAQHLVTQVPRDMGESDDLRGVTVGTLASETAYDQDEIIEAMQWLERLGRVELQNDRVVLDE